MFEAVKAVREPIPPGLIVRVALAATMGFVLGAAFHATLPIYSLELDLEYRALICGALVGLPIRALAPSETLWVGVVGGLVALVAAVAGDTISGFHILSSAGLNPTVGAASVYWLSDPVTVIVYVAVTVAGAFASAGVLFRKGRGLSLE